MRAGLLLVICLVGCGRVGYTALPSVVADAGEQDAGPFDAGVRDAGADASDAGPADAGPADASIDDAGHDGGVDASIDLPCGAIVLVDDDFEDGVTGADWRLFAHDGITTVEETGRVHVRLAASVDAPRYGGYETMPARDLTGFCTTLDVAVVPSTTTDALAFVKIIAGAREVEILESAGLLYARTWDTGVITNIADVPYDPVAHRHWRIRDAGGSIRLEVSADGVAFTELATVTEPISFASAVVAFGAGAYVPTTDGGDAQLERFTLTSR